MRFFVETRSDGLPWTKEGCNRRNSTSFIPWGSKEEAREEMETRKSGKDPYQDPMWADAEYRLVPARFGS